MSYGNGNVNRSGHGGAYWNTMPSHDGQPYNRPQDSYTHSQMPPLPNPSNNPHQNTFPQSQPTYSQPTNNGYINSNAHQNGYAPYPSQDPRQRQYEQHRDMEQRQQIAMEQRQQIQRAQGEQQQLQYRRQQEQRLQEQAQGQARAQREQEHAQRQFQHDTHQAQTLPRQQAQTSQQHPQQYQTSKQTYPGPCEPQYRRQLPNPSPSGAILYDYGNGWLGAEDPPQQGYQHQSTAPPVVRFQQFGVMPNQSQNHNYSQSTPTSQAVPPTLIHSMAPIPSPQPRMQQRPTAPQSRHQNTTPQPLSGNHRPPAQVQSGPAPNDSPHGQSFTVPPSARQQVPVQQSQYSQYQQAQAQPAQLSLPRAPTPTKSPSGPSPNQTMNSQPSSRPLTAPLKREMAIPEPVPQQFVAPSQLLQTPKQPSSTRDTKIATKTNTYEGQVNSSQTQSKSSEQPDMPNLMVALAEEFFEAAHKLAPSIAISGSSDTLEEYHNLISKGLGALDSTLRNLKMPPRLGAMVRLRYAGVLFEETENFMEAEEALGKGITLCDRNHYFDLKYSMKFLLAQIVFKKNPKAALAALDGAIEDAEAHRHISWIYALRLLRASHSLNSGLPGDKWKENFDSITATAQKYDDRGVRLAAHLMEALAYLRSNDSRCMEDAQSAIAAAQSYENSAGTKIPQLTALTHIIGVCCSIRQDNPKLMVEKLKAMSAMMDSILDDDKSWGPTDDRIIIPIRYSDRQKSGTVSHDTRAVLGIGSDGSDTLILSFLGKNDAFAITYLLGGIVLMHKNTVDDSAMQYLQRGYNQLESSTRTDSKPSDILPHSIARMQWRGQILCHYLIHMAFCAVAVGDWAKVKSHSDKLSEIVGRLEISLRGSLGYLATYLSGVLHQGIGDLETALAIFESQKFDISTHGSINANVSEVERDFSILAALNALWIRHAFKDKSLHKNSIQIAELASLCRTHPNTDIKTAFSLISATVKTDPPVPMIEIRNHLAPALKGATKTSNTLFTCMTLSIMCSKFFLNTSGEQAKKSAMAASEVAHKSQNGLWMAVADGMMGHNSRMRGEEMEARRIENDAMAMMTKAFPLDS